MSEGKEGLTSPRTVTRADLAETVYRRVGLSRSESAELVQAFLDEISEAATRGETVKLSSFGSFVVRSKNQRIGRNPKTGVEVPILPRRVMVFKPSNVLKARINGDAGRRKSEDLDEARRQEPGGFSHHQRGRGQHGAAAARAELLGDAVSPDQAAEAWRRAALLPPRRRRTLTRHQGVAVRPGVHDQGRAEDAAGAGRAERHARRGGAGLAKSRACAPSGQPAVEPARAEPTLAPPPPVLRA